MNQQTVMVSCPKRCKDNCEDCRREFYTDLVKTGDQVRDQHFGISSEVFETPAKFRHLETIPLKPGIEFGYDYGINHTQTRRCHSHNCGRKPRYSDKRRRLRLAPIMAEQFARQMEEQTQWSWQTSLYYEEIMNGFCQEFDRYNDDCQFLMEQSTLEEQEEEWADHESSFEDDDHTETPREIMERPWA
jgi:hypothetical protein